MRKKCTHVQTVDSLPFNYLHGIIVSYHNTRSEIGHYQRKLESNGLLLSSLSHWYVSIFSSDSNSTQHKCLKNYSFFDFSCIIFALMQMHRTTLSTYYHVAIKKRKSIGCLLNVHILSFVCHCYQNFPFHVFFQIGIYLFTFEWMNK